LIFDFGNAATVCTTQMQ